MGLFSFIHGKTGRLILHRLYGWGAALVILGALFKLMHWEGASEMLIIGMSTECVIFFLSAFEPMGKEFDWSLVYPEFAGDDGEIRDTVPSVRQQMSGGTGVYGGGGVAGFDLNIDSQTTDELKSGIQKLTSSLNQMTSLSGIVDASNELVGNIRQASTSVTGVSQSANLLSENYQKTSQSINTLNEQSKSSLEQIRLGYDAYRGQLDNLSRTLSAVNSSYELYLQETNKVQSDYSTLHNEMSKLIASVQVSSNQTHNFGSQMEGLNNNISQLNSIYGSMLTAVNSVINK